MKRLRGAAAGLLLLFAAPAVAADAPPPLIPAEAFGALPFLSAPDISPDGRHLVAGSVVAGKKAVLLADLDAPDFGVSDTPLADKVDVLSVRWAGNHRVLISLLVPASSSRSSCTSAACSSTISPRAR